LRRGLRLATVIRRPPRQLYGLRQIDEPSWDSALHRVGQRLPLWREVGERIVDRLVGRIWHIEQQSDRRLHLLVGYQRQHGVRVGRSLNQHNVWLQPFQRLAQRTSASRPVVANAENSSAHGYN